MDADTERLNIVLPRELAEELRARIPLRRRSEFIAQALADKLARLRQVKAVREAVGAWSDEEHPDLTTDEDYETWKRGLRGGVDDRLRSLGLDARGEDVSPG